MRRILVLAVALAAIAGGAGAQAAPDIPEDVLKSIQRSPSSWERTAIGLILGFGGPNGLTAQGLDQAIEVQRAEVRARARADLLVADLNDDGAVSTEERDLALRPLSESHRARLVQRLLTADANGDGTVTSAEVTAAARRVADAEPDADQLARLRAILAMNADGKGGVTVDELHRGLQRLIAK